MNQDNQSLVLSEIKKLAQNGEDFSHLVKFLEPEYFLRTKVFIQSLPRKLAHQTIFGKAHWVQTKYNTPHRKSVTRSDL